MRFTKQLRSLGRCLAVPALCLGLSAIPLHAAGMAGKSGSMQETLPQKLDLDTCLNLALKNNFSIRQAQERIKQQQGVLIQVKAQSIPTADLTYYYNKEDRGLVLSYPGITPSTQAWAVELQVKQALYAGGGISSSIKSQRINVAAATLDLKATINDALLQVRQRYYDVLLAREEVKVREQSLKLLREQLKTAEDRYKAGAVSNFDYLRAQVAVANGRPPLIRARNNYRISIEQLREAIGVGSNSIDVGRPAPTIAGKLSYKPEKFTLDAALTAARENRPELQRIAKLVQAGEQNVRAQHAGNRPSLYASAGYEITKSSFSNRLGDTLNGWLLGIQGSWPIFDGRATQGKVQQARSALEQTRLQGDQLSLSIEVEVRQQFSAFQEATQLVSASGKTVDQAKEALRLARARYKAGSATQLDVLDAEVSLTEARSNQVQALHDYDVAIAGLRKAMGVADPIITQSPN